MKVDMCSRNAFAGMATLTPTAEDASITKGVEYAMANPRTVSTQIPPNTSNSHVILVRSVKVAELYGVPESAIRSEQGFAATATSNPANYVQWIFQVQNPYSADTLNIPTTFKLVLDVEFFNRKFYD